MRPWEVPVATPTHITRSEDTKTSTVVSSPFDTYCSMDLASFR